MKYLIALVLVVFLTGSVTAQLEGQALIDSIISALPSLPEDTTKVGLYGKLVALQYSIDPKAGISSAEEGLALAKKLNWLKGMITWVEEVIIPEYFFLESYLFKTMIEE